jgi:threonine synthase
MRYFSLNKNSLPVDFKQATIAGLAPDKGLYFPEFIPQLENDLVVNIENYSNAEIAFQVIKPYVGDCIPSTELKRICEETVNFEIPLVPVTERISSLELFHGPTLAFKDVGARFMSRCLGYFAKDRKEKVIVLVATSGDTGSAVANGFYGIEGIEVVILYPSGKVSAVQEKQLTTLGKNIHTLEVNGNFDDCQRMVKAAFVDEDLNKKLFLTSANSINIARWLPQQFYYFFAWKQWADKSGPPVVCVPCGNFGNICAGMLAWRSGLPVKHFIAACNSNDTVPRYFKTDNYTPQQAVPTISNAMDVADPSNFVRMMELFSNDSSKLKNIVSASSLNDDETRSALKRVKDQFNYLCDPHGAIAFDALEEYLKGHPDEKGYFLETAHPVKFFDVVEPVINSSIAIPPAVKEQMSKEKLSTKIEANNDALKPHLFTL